MRCFMTVDEGGWGFCFFCREDVGTPEREEEKSKGGCISPLNAKAMGVKFDPDSFFEVLHVTAVDK